MASRQHMKEFTQLIVFSARWHQHGREEERDTPRTRTCTPRLCPNMGGLISDLHQWLCSLLVLNSSQPTPLPTIRSVEGHFMRKPCSRNCGLWCLPVDRNRWVCNHARPSIQTKFSFVLPLKHCQSHLSISEHMGYDWSVELYLQSTSTLSRRSMAPAIPTHGDVELEPTLQVAFQSNQFRGVSYPIVLTDCYVLYTLIYNLAVRFCRFASSRHQDFKLLSRPAMSSPIKWYRTFEAYKTELLMYNRSHTELEPHPEVIQWRSPAGALPRLLANASHGPGVRLPVLIGVPSDCHRPERPRPMGWAPSYAFGANDGS
ncbi:hypothetical protein C8Q70DRAFT_548717 [Cubamyces menziesii]|nr:hypothetical protein C8Q70DRAFT_548717 [Cubamyces menziesii]